jgi:hypothetical protein
MGNTQTISADNGQEISECQVVKVATAAKKFGVSVDHIMRWGRTGKIRLIDGRAGNRAFYMVVIEDIFNLLRSRQVQEVRAARAMRSSPSHQGYIQQRHNRAVDGRRN